MHLTFRDRRKTTTSEFGQLLCVLWNPLFMNSPMQPTPHTSIINRSAWQFSLTLMHSLSVVQVTHARSIHP
jgi:hypothetical protein